MKHVINVIFPKTIDNEFRGYKISLYLFYVLTAVTLWRSQHHLFAADGGAQSIATIPLDSFSISGAQAVVGAFGLWGLSQLIIGLVYLLASIRYKAIIPFLYLLMAFEYLIRATYIPWFKPVPTAGTAPGSVINIPFVIFSITMLILCIVGDKKRKSAK